MDGDGALFIIENCSKVELKWYRKNGVELILNFWLFMSIDSRSSKINYLDTRLNLETMIYKPYHTNECLRYM